MEFVGINVGYLLVQLLLCVGVPVAIVVGFMMFRKRKNESSDEG